MTTSMQWGDEASDRIQARAVYEIIAERDGQDRIWGVQDHDLSLWLMILSEEVGEFSKAALEAFVMYETESCTLYDRKIAEARRELVQVAAVAMAMIECIDRGAWMWRGAPILDEDLDQPAEET